MIAIGNKIKTMENTLFDKAFRDSNGEIVWAQLPNPPLIAWIIATSLKLVFTTGTINMGLDVFAFGALFTWAWGELFQGVNYFRRALGAIFLIAAIASKVFWS